MNISIQPPVPPNPTVASVNTAATIQPVSGVTAATAIGEGSAGAIGALGALPNGTTVEGFVVNRDAQNNPILRTAIGDLRVTSEVFLKTGSEVIIRVDNTLSSLARILSVDGLTPQDYSNQTQAARSGITQDTISQSSLQPLLNNASAAAPKAGAAIANPVLQAVILQGQPAAATPSLLASALAATQSGPVQALAQLAQLRAGTPIRLTVLDLKLPPIAVALGSVPQSAKLDNLLPAPGTTPQQTTPAVAQNPVSQPIAPPAQAATLPIENELAPLQTAVTEKATLSAALQTTKLADPLLAPTDNKQAPPTVTVQPGAERPALTPTAPNQISASVIGHDADGANILHTPFATLKVYTPQPLPSGTTLLVSAQVETDSAVTPHASIAEEQLASIVPKGDKVIDDVLAWMLTNQPDIARELQQRLPNIHRNLSSGLLFFIAAIKGGDVGEVIGKRALRLLETSAPELLARLRQEVGQIQSSIADSPLVHWTLYPLSMMGGQEMQHARLYVGKEPNENAAAAGDTSRGQRFVLEVDLSQLGSMQFDGFIRNNDGKKSFDLMVRSANSLEPQLANEIRTIFENSSAITGLKGQIVFQQGSQHFIRPMADSKPRSNGEGHNTILA